MAGLIIKKQQKQAFYYREILRKDEQGVEIPLDMMEIPGGEFMMGTDEAEIARLCQEYELDYFQSESPQHKVSVPRFFLGKYPITQGQWKAIANRTDLRIAMDLNPEPAYFQEAYQKEENNLERWQRPVENVNWYETIEFCLRLSKLTGKDYRLPTEAQWEYACRAGTTTAFHFGSTITTDFANYRGTDWEYKGKVYPGNYGRGPLGVYRQETTPVGLFKVANEFGLYDMHGNVWEWCLDPWHDNYNGAPKDGRVWDDNYQQQDYQQHFVNNIKEILTDERNRVLRGGSWDPLPDECRCAFRSGYDPVARYDVIGFRVVCLP